MSWWIALDELQTESAERKARKAEIDEQRAYEEKRFTERLRQEKIAAAIPLLVERRQKQAELAKQREVLGNYFEDRLGTEDVPEETRTAFVNLAVQTPTYATDLIGAINKAEETAKRRLSGTEIIKMSRLFEQTKPEQLSIQDWVKQASGMVVADESGFNFDETLTRLIAGDISEQDFLTVQTEVMSPLGGGGLNIIPDFDTTAILGLDPTKGKALKDFALEEMKLRLQRDRAEISAKMEELQAGGDPEEIKKLDIRNREIESLANAEDPDAAIFDYYAPIVLPELAARQPELKDYFPSYFTPASQGLTDEDLKYLGY